MYELAGQRSGSTALHAIRWLQSSTQQHSRNSLRSRAFAVPVIWACCPILVWFVSCLLPVDEGFECAAMVSAGPLHVTAALLKHRQDDLQVLQ
jgi:hypothetical protein